MISNNYPLTEILVIEDDPVTYTQIMLTLKRLGVQQVRFACNGAEALVILSRHTPNLIFLDIEMPVMNGFEFLDVLQGLDISVADTPVVILSNSFSPSIEEKAFKFNNVQDILKKPFSLRKVKEVISTVILGPDSQQQDCA